MNGYAFKGGNSAIWLPFRVCVCVGGGGGGGEDEVVHPIVKFPPIGAYNF